MPYSIIIYTTCPLLKSKVVTQKMTFLYHRCCKINFLSNTICVDLAKNGFGCRKIDCNEAFELLSTPMNNILISITNDNQLVL